jgi:hypothetical protein
MTNEQILRLAIEKAVKNGYLDLSTECNFISQYENGLEIWEVYLKGDYKTTLGEDYSIIFSHPFLKAFFGEEWNLFGDGYMFDWQYHAQQLVISEDPIKYLGKFI